MMARLRSKLPSARDGLLRLVRFVEEIAALGVEAEMDGRLAAIAGAGDRLRQVIAGDLLARFGVARQDEVLVLLAELPVLGREPASASLIVRL